MFWKTKKTPEERQKEANQKALRRAIVKKTKDGWKAEDVDLNNYTATLTRASMSAQRKAIRVATFRAFFPGKTDRVETMFIYVDEKGRVKESRSKRNFT